MKRFKQILYYTDASEGSRAALERAAELALRNRGRLTVLGVVQLPPDLQLLAPALPPAELWDMATQDLRERLEQFVEPVRQKGLRLDVEVLYGTPFIEIIRHVLDHGHDLVMMNAEGGRGGLKGLFFGSTSLHLMRKCPCPVWVIKPGPHRRFERILAAVNPRSVRRGPPRRQQQDHATGHLARPAGRQRTAGRPRLGPSGGGRAARARRACRRPRSTKSCATPARRTSRG